MFDPNFLRVADGCEWKFVSLTQRGVPIAATPCTTLAPFDLTRGGNYFLFNGHIDVKQLAISMQDADLHQEAVGASILVFGAISITGSSVARQAEPRVGVAYNIQKTNTVLRCSYARAR